MYAAFRSEERVSFYQSVCGISPPRRQEFFVTPSIESVIKQDRSKEKPV